MVEVEECSKLHLSNNNVYTAFAQIKVHKMMYQYILFVLFAVRVQLFCKRKLKHLDHFTENWHSNILNLIKVISYRLS